MAGQWQFTMVEEKKRLQHIQGLRFLQVDWHIITSPDECPIGKPGAYVQLPSCF